MRIGPTLYFIFTFTLLIVSTQSNCHYTCSQCDQQYYYSCLTCPNNQSLSLPTSNSQHKFSGACGHLTTNSSNLLGIFLLIIVIIGCVAFLNQTVYYFAFIIQTLGLLYFIQIYWIYPIDYILQSFSYMMVFSYITFPFKTQSPTNFIQKTGYKTIFYLKSPNIKQNVLVIGPLFLTTTLLLIIVPIFKYCRRKFIKGQHHCIQDCLLQKITLGLKTLFLFLIQQISLVLSLTLSYSKEKQKHDYVFLAIFILILILFFVNICSHPLPYFRNKISQFLYILLKTIGPPLVSLQVKFGFIFILFTVLLLFFDAIVTNKNPDAKKFNKLLIYKFFIKVIVVIIFIYYLVQRLKNTQSFTKIFGVIASIAISFFIYLFILEIFLNIKQTYYDSKKVAEVIEQTLQNVNNEDEVHNNKQNIKIHVAEHIAQNNSLQNDSIQNMNINITLTSQQNITAISTVLEIKTKTKLNLNSQFLTQPKNKSEVQNEQFNESQIEQDVCEIFVPQLQNFEHNGQSQNQLQNKAYLKSKKIDNI